MGRRLWVALAFSLVVAGCGDSSDGDAGEARPEFGAGEQFSIAGALRQIPLDHAFSADGRTNIAVGDLLSISESLGQSRPTGSTDADEANRWLDSTVGAPVWVPFPETLQRSVQDPGEYKDEVGFSTADVDATIEWFPGTVMTVLSGALQPPATSIEVADGVRTIGEGSDFEIDIANRTLARHLGRPLRIATDDGLLFMSASTDAALAWLDPESPRLDSDAAFAIAAEILDEHGVISAVLIRDDFSSSDAPEAYVTTAFNTVAVGWGLDDGEAAITVVYVTADESTAETAAGQIEAAFVSGLSLETGQPIADDVIVNDVTTHDSAVAVSLSLPPDHQRPGTILGMIYSRESPFAYVP